MDGNVISSTSEENDLKNFVNDKLSFSKHIGKAAAKANNVSGMVKMTFTYITKESFLVLYKTYIRPHLEYYVQVWSPHLKKDKETWEKVQGSCTRYSKLKVYRMSKD